MPVVQKQVQDPSSVSNGSTVAYGSNVTAGNALIFIGPFYNGGATTVTDSQGNTWTRKSNTVTFAPSYLMCVFTAVAGSSGPNTITVAVTAGGNLYGSVLLEVSGLQADPFDQVGAVQVNTSSPMTAGSITPTVDGAYIAGFFSRGAVVNNYSSSGVFTFQAQSPGNGSVGYCDYTQPTAAAIQAVIAGSASASYPVRGMGISFKAAAPPAPLGPPMQRGSFFPWS